MTTIGTVARSSASSSATTQRRGRWGGIKSFPMLAHRPLVLVVISLLFVTTAIAAAPDPARPPTTTSASASSPLIVGGGGSQSSRPDGADPAFDCAMRRLALDFASGLLSNSGRNGVEEELVKSSVFDALELGPLCGDDYGKRRGDGASRVGIGGGGKEDDDEKEGEEDDSEEAPSSSSSSSAATLFVDALMGCDVTHPGTRSKPLRTLHRAVALSRSRSSPLSSPAAPRTIYLISGGGEQRRVYHLPSTVRLDEEDSHLTIAGYNPGDGGSDLPIVSGAIPLTGLEWSPAKDIPHPENVFVARIPESVPIDDVPGLHFASPSVGASGRAVMARYPNTPDPFLFDPTLPGGDGRIPQGRATFLPPKNYSESDYNYINVDRPSRDDAEGGWYSHYTVGVGGSCEIYDPPVSYWCSNSTRGGGASKFRVPTGMIFNSSFLPNLDMYTEEGLDGAVVNIWRPARWANWMFEGKYNSTTKEFTFTRGGFQGARGNDVGGDWFIENVLAELDAPNEYYYDRKTRMLYLCVNATDGITHPDQLGLMSVPKLEALFRIEGSSPDAPVTNVTLTGLHLTGTRHTHLSAPHGVPSGGDWALERRGTVFLENTQCITVERCAIERVDGHGVFISGKNVNATVADNDIRFVGGTGVASWGRTDGELDEGGFTAFRRLYPDGNRIVGNVIHEVGHYEKQNAFYFQSKTARTVIDSNVMFNGPRAGINLNDGFAGGDVIRRNLVFNTCRESGDHGPLNSWDRQPFLTPGSPRNGTGMDWRIVKHNFFVANYHSQEAIDTDDGSAYCRVSDNFMVYSTNGLKSDFRGHDVRHSRNVYAYVGNCMNDDAQSPQLVGHEDAFRDNRCVLSPNGTYAYFDVTGSWPFMGNNEIYVTNEKPPPPKPGPNGTHDGYHRLWVNNYTIQEFQEKFPGVDDGTRVFYGGVGADSIMAWAREVLQMSDRGEGEGSSKKNGESLSRPEMAARLDKKIAARRTYKLSALIAKATSRTRISGRRVYR